MLSDPGVMANNGLNWFTMSIVTIRSSRCLYLSFHESRMINCTLPILLLKKIGVNIIGNTMMGKKHILRQPMFKERNMSNLEYRTIMLTNHLGLKKSPWTILSGSPEWKTVSRYCHLLELIVILRKRRCCLPGLLASNLNLNILPFCITQ